MEGNATDVGNRHEAEERDDPQHTRYITWPSRRQSKVVPATGHWERWEEVERKGGDASRRERKVNKPSGVQVDRTTRSR